MATHSSTLAWRLSWTEEPGGLQSMGCKESDVTEWLMHTCVYDEKESHRNDMTNTLHLAPSGGHCAPLAFSLSLT